MAKGLECPPKIFIDKIICWPDEKKICKTYANLVKRKVKRKGKRKRERECVEENERKGEGEGGKGFISCHVVTLTFG